MINLDGSQSHLAMCAQRTTVCHAEGLRAAGLSRRYFDLASYYQPKMQFRVQRPLPRQNSQTREPANSVFNKNKHILQEKKRMLENIIRKKNSDQDLKSLT